MSLTRTVRRITRFAIVMLSCVPGICMAATKPHHIATPPTRIVPTNDPNLCSFDNLQRPATPHLLFIMFLTAPPGNKDPDWALQNISTTEFDTCDACLNAAASITASLQNVSTINLAGWCFSKVGIQREASVAAGAPPAPAAGVASSKLTEFNSVKSKLSSDLQSKLDAEIAKNPAFQGGGRLQDFLANNKYIQSLPKNLQDEISDAVKKNPSIAPQEAAPPSSAIHVTKPLILQPYK